MKMKSRCLIFALLALGLCEMIDAGVEAAAPLSRLVLTTGSLTEREGVLYVAQDQGFFRKYGMDVTPVQVRNGPVGMAALSSGESQFHWESVSAANLGAIAEGADLVFVAGFIDRLSGVFLANPRIKAPADLKGKSIGVNSLSGGAWIFSMLALDHWGLAPAREQGENPSVDGVRDVIRLLGANGEKIRRLKAENLVFDNVVRKLEKEGRF